MNVKFVLPDIVLQLTNNVELNAEIIVLTADMAIVSSAKKDIIQSKELHIALQMEIQKFNLDVLTQLVWNVQEAPNIVTHALKVFI